MASRMERYYKQNSSRSKRSERNQSLYKDIYDSSSYSNIEGIATIEKSNEIDITKVKKMLKNREEYQKQKEVSRFMEQKQPMTAVKPLQVDDLDHTRNYDIRDILDKAKDNKKNSNPYHRIDNTSYDILKKLKDKKDEYPEGEDDEQLKELIHTITSNSMMNQLDDQALSLDLLDDLKASGDETIIDNKDSIKNILEEVKKEEKKPSMDSTSEMDKSFFTSSLSFKEDDFEQIANLNNNLAKNNVLLKILMLVFLIVITGTIIFLVYHFIK